MARVAFAGTFDRGFNRNKRLRQFLEGAGHEVVLCQVDLWGSDRYEIPNQRKAKMLARGLLAYPRLIWRFLRLRKPDAVIVGYPGWFDMLVIGPLARMRRVPVIFDPFISLSDTVVSDRKLASRSSVIGRATVLVDKLSLRLATRVLTDTPQHAAFYAELAGIGRERIGVVWLGAQDDVFVPQHVDPAPRLVVFHGTFIALQGVDTILHAAKLLEADGINMRVIGAGQEQAMVDAVIAELQPTNVDLVGRLPLEQLPGEIARAAVCFGIFGTSDKAQRVIPNKVFECVAMGRPVITADTPALREAFGADELVLVPAGDPRALADAVRRLVAEPETREKMAAAAHEHYLAAYATEPLTRLLDAQLQQVL
jgi:glycosyltransferase involved in cell wall biosynthesis